MPSPDCRKKRRGRRVGGKTKGNDMQVKDTDQKKKKHGHAHIDTYTISERGHII